MCECKYSYESDFGECNVKGQTIKSRNGSNHKGREPSWGRLAGDEGNTRYFSTFVCTDYFYMEAMRDSLAEECRGVEELKMRKGDVVKVYRVTKGKIQFQFIIAVIYLILYIRST